MGTGNIGNYIHYHKNNYIKYGIGYKEKNWNGNYNYGQYRSKMLTLLKNNNAQRFSKEYELTLNRFYGNLNQIDNVSQYSIQKQQELVKAINEVLRKQFNMADDMVRIDKNGNFILFAEKGNTASKGFTSRRKEARLKVAKNQYGITRSTLMKYYKDSILIYNFLQKQGRTSQQELQSNLEKIKKFRKDVTNFLSKNRNQKVFHQNTYGDTLPGLISSMVDIYNFDYQLKNALDTGIIAEVAKGFAATFVANQGSISVKKMKKYIYKALSGTKESSPLMQMEKDSQGVLRNNVFYQDLGYSTFNFNQGKSQNKADVTVTFNNQPITISSKNYSQYRYQNEGISTSAATSLLTYLVDEDHNFINHWLNTTTLSNENSLSGGNNLASKIQKNHNIMKLIILVKSIRGAAGRSGNANIFSINIRKGNKNKFTVLTLYDIVNNITRGGLTGIHIDNYPDLIVQKWEGNRKDYSRQLANSRIDKILDSILETKVSVHLGTKASLINTF